MSAATRPDASVAGGDGDWVSGLAWPADGGLLPQVVQHAHDGRVLMLGYVDAEAVRATLRSGEVHFHSRSRGRLWRKGESSGHVLRLVSLAADCDRDALLCQALPAGPTCHRGTSSCFDGERSAHGWLVELAALVRARRGAAPGDSYVAGLFAQGRPRLAQKVGEEGVELALAAVAGDAVAIRGEAADLLFHLLVLLEDCDLDLADVVGELARRHRPRDRAD